jgi:Cytochrome P460
LDLSPWEGCAQRDAFELEGDIGMIKRTPVVAGLAAALVLTGAAAVFAQTSSALIRPYNKTRYLPEYTESGELKLPKNFDEWVYVGSPLTPNALNGGKANFPEFHNVYIEPGSYEIYKNTGVFPEGTIFFKELQLTLPAENPDGSRTEPSGRGFFPGPLNGADVTVKDSTRFADSGGWGYFNFNHHEPKAATAKVRPKEECAYCHIASAKKDEVWTQFYPLLDN